MNWEIYFGAALLIIVLGIGKSVSLGKAGNKRRGILNSFHVLFGTVFASAAVLFLPIYNQIFADEPFQYVKVLLLSIHNTIRLFVVDGEFTIITDYITVEEGWIFTAYTLLASILFVLAPVLTFGFVLFLFKNISAYQRYVCCYFRDVYIFSELSEKSLTLAESLRKHSKKRGIIFMDVFERNDEESYEWIERAGELGAICFKKDIQAVDFKFHSKRKSMYFFAIGQDESENIDQALKIIPEYRNREHTHLYVFSTRVDGELLLTSLDKGLVKVRRVNDIRSLINRILYEEGEKIFQHALDGKNGIKEITAVIVGMGKHGANMAKALTWFCQMDGYSVEIHMFDQDPLLEETFSAQCPELLDKDYNGIYVPGEAQYRMVVHGGISVETRRFAEEIGKLDRATYVFVALGSDEENIRTAVNLRMLFERNGAQPAIQAVVYNSAEKKALKGIANYQGQPYKVDFIGDLETSYSEEVIIDSQLEAEALLRHKKWGNEEEFWKYEYNYRSSVASAIHMRAREWCKIPGAGKPEEELTPEELAVIEVLEHRRWNAYMRSEGYIYSGSPDKSSRNDLGKMHHDLVCFSHLTEEEKRKDSRVGTR
ncbi:MAG: hypothetical protein HFI33_05155 [Lachnospiraceae bacterium]|nr:hypothetical protein [Lachnospiraceae bacterium]